jgi:hypothetical protein
VRELGTHENSENPIKYKGYGTTQDAVTVNFPVKSVDIIKTIQNIIIWTDTKCSEEKTCIGLPSKHKRKRM